MFGGGAVSLAGEGKDLGTELRRLWLLVRDTSVWVWGTAGPDTLPPQDEPQGHGSRSRDSLLLAPVLQVWPCIHIPEGSRVSLGCALGRQRLAVPLEAICECLWSNKLKGNAKAVRPASWPGREAGGGTPARGRGTHPTRQPPPRLELVIRAEQQSLLVVAGAAEAVGARQAVGATVPVGPGLQRGLLRVLLVGGREVVDGVLHDVVRVHGLLEAAGDALHGGAAACGAGAGPGEGLAGRRRGCSAHPKSRGRPRQAASSNHPLLGQRRVLHMVGRRQRDGPSGWGTEPREPPGREWK